MPRPFTKPRDPKDWRGLLAGVGAETRGNRGRSVPRRRPSANDAAELLYSLLPQRRGIHLRLFRRKRRLRSGAPGAPQVLSAQQAIADPNLDREDKRIASLLLGTRDGGGYGHWARVQEGMLLVGELVPDILAAADRTGRLFGADGTGNPEREPGVPARWLGEPAWAFRLRVTAGPDAVEVHPEFFRGSQVRHLDEPGAQLYEGLLISVHGEPGAPERRFEVGPEAIDPDQLDRWLDVLPDEGPLRAPLGDGPALVAALLGHPDAPALEIEGKLRPPEERFEPVGGVRLDRAPSGGAGGAGATVGGSVRFFYGGVGVDAPDPRPTLHDPEAHRLLPRDPAAEAALLATLPAAGFTDHGEDEGPADEDGQRRLHRRVSVDATGFPAAAAQLNAAGWKLEFDGRRLRAATGPLALRVSTGIDWFNVSGEADFDGTALELDAVLAAIARQERYVQLGDGSVGLLPEEWLRRYSGLAQLGEADGEGHRRVASTQIALLDALLEAEPEADFDAAASAARERLKTLEAPGPMDPPPGFVGALRDYQRAGLGWLHALSAVGLSGCLADDMGLGKTVQVLAWLQGILREEPEGDLARPPALVVVPRSLLENWRREAAAFTPGLSVFTLHGPKRWADADAGLPLPDPEAPAADQEAAALALADATSAHLCRHDLVLTTYATLRADAPRLATVPFAAAVLDEAQAVKNDRTAAAKAVRLIRADRRLAVSGTPVENHLGELLSIFDFLNPGMLRGAEGILRAARADAGDTLSTDIPPEIAAAKQLSAAVRPFVLRRTKKQVAPELPDRIEETLWCEMPPAQEAFYKKLAAAYRKSLLRGMDNRKLKTSKIQVLEALLRLRQAACLPVLADPKKGKLPGAKLEVLRERLSQVLDEPEAGKALVFSQFVGLLDHVRKPLDEAKVPYAYLDGRTRDRQAQVDRFQDDPGCRLMLISLKAGGTGLNLTAAEHVFLLDPWWNPAAEAQAIDRAHRIGQRNTVFARRLITRGTVEEKVLELQGRKKELAEALLGDPSSVMQSLSLDDLRELLS